MLVQFFGCYLNEDWPEEFGTPEKAVEAAIDGYPLDLRRRIRSELAAVLAAYEGDDTQLRAVLNDGFHVNVHFREPRLARAFAEEAERKLMISIRTAYES